MNRNEYTFTKYKRREVTFLKILKSGDWNIKMYGINLKNLANKSIELFIKSKLPSPALTQNRYGMGFLILHKGVVANWVMLNWWGYEDVVHQKIFTADDEFRTVKAVKDDSIMACVHELDIYNFESNAWKKNILSLQKPDFDGYLKDIY